MSKEHSHAYEAGYRDGSVNYELEHCSACKNVADLQEVLDENARLLSQLTEWKRVAESKQDIIDHMRDANAENAKLRELVNGMRYCAHEAYGMCARVPVGGERPFTCCPLYDFDAKEYRCEKLMRELGIEVDK